MNTCVPSQHSKPQDYVWSCTARQGSVDKVCRETRTYKAHPGHVRTGRTTAAPCDNVPPDRTNDVNVPHAPSARTSTQRKLDQVTPTPHSVRGTAQGWSGRLPFAMLTPTTRRNTGRRNTKSCQFEHTKVTSSCVTSPRTQEPRKQSVLCCPYVNGYSIRLQW